MITAITLGIQNLRRYVGSYDSCVVLDFGFALSVAMSPQVYSRRLCPCSNHYENLNGLDNQRCIQKTWHKFYGPCTNISAGWVSCEFHFSSFINLRKLALRVEDDGGFFDIEEICTVLDRNESTLKHLILGTHQEHNHSWDLAFKSVAIKNLTHLDLVSTCVSHFVLTRIPYAHNLQSLTLHGWLVDPDSASDMFGTDRIVDGTHTLLPHLEAFRFVMPGQNDEHPLYHSIARFLQKRDKLRRLDLGDCPWDIVQSILPNLRNLRVLGVHVKHLSQVAINSLVESIPTQMVAINISVDVSDRPLVRIFLSLMCGGQLICSSERICLLFHSL